MSAYLKLLNIKMKDLNDGFQQNNRKLCDVIKLQF